MNLEALQRAMHDAVKDHRPVSEVAAELGVDPARLAIYRRMVRGHVLTALVSRLPETTRRLGAVAETPAWHALFEHYLQAHPPSAPTLPEAAAAFPGFLAEHHEALGLHPAVAALAELEWALFAVNRDATELPAPAAHPVLNPTLQVLQWPWPVASELAARRRGEDPPPPAPGEELVLLFRRPATGHPCFHVATPARLFAIKVVHEGMTVAQASEAAGQPVEVVAGVLDEARAIGLVIG